MTRQPSQIPHTIKTLPSQEEQDRLLAECREIDAENQKRWAELQAQFKALRDEVAQFMGYNHLRYNPRDTIRVWMDKGPLTQSLIHLTRPWTSLMAEQFDRIKQGEIQAQKKAEQEARQKHDALKPARAILFLMKHGQVGDSGTVDPAQAVYLANGYAHRTLVAQKMAEGGPFSFSGEDNCEDCEGWDGESHRCDCGNRRVEWEMSGDFEDFDKGTAYVHGEAY